MNGLPYYKAYPRDFIEGTIGLDFETKAAYRLVLDLIYMQGGALPDDARYISGLLGCSVKKWNSLRERLIEAGKIYVCGDHLRNYRADKELEILGKFQDKQRENRARPNKNNRLESPRSNHTEPEPEPEKRDDADASSCAKAPQPARFADFWDAYPHRGGTKRNRKGAEAKYRAAVKAGIPEQDIIEGAKRAHSDQRVRDGYARDPTTWLNQEGWKDEITEGPNDHGNFYGGNIAPFGPKERRGSQFPDGLVGAALRSRAARAH